jgi:hypothetical protein
MILRHLAEGNSVRSTSRLCDVEKRTVLNLLKTAGDCCERFMASTLHDVPVRDLQLDECWSYVLKKEGHKLPHEENDETIGDQYIFIGLERTSKLVVAWHLGKRNRENTVAFISKVRSATANKTFDISTDALALHFWYYDFARLHGALRVTPAMESGLSDHVWTIGELLMGRN